jgi:hypothetical protein
MNYQNIAEVYAANDQIREKLISIVENLSAADAELRADAESWTIREIVEHISIVENGMAKISAKLLSKAEASSGENGGKAKIGAEFVKRAGAMRGQKFKAPEMVAPTGTQTLAESLAKMKENRRMLEELRPRFEKIETLDATFPHPFLGDLNAHEWLALVGGHEARHIAQIEKILRQHKPA